MIVLKTRERIQRHWPDLTEALTDDLRIRRENAWMPPDEGCLTLTRRAGSGTIMGRVTATGWRAEGRIYFQVQGPESPDAADQKVGTVFCEAVYPWGEGRKIEQYTADRVRILWQLRGQTTGYSVVSRSRYRIHREAGCVKLTFWTSEGEPPESLLFRYREEGEEGFVSFRVPLPTRN